MGYPKFIKTHLETGGADASMRILNLLVETSRDRDGRLRKSFLILLWWFNPPVESTTLWLVEYY